MTDEDDKVKVEFDLPKDQVSIHDADSEKESDSDEQSRKEGLEKAKDEALEKLSETREKLKETRAELKEKEEKEEDNESIVKKATGYETGELLAAPVSPPEAEASKRPARGQIRSLIIGFFLVIIGLIAWPIFGFAVFISIVLVGAALVAIGVLVRI